MLRWPLAGMLAMAGKAWATAVPRSLSVGRGPLHAGPAAALRIAEVMAARTRLLRGGAFAALSRGVLAPDTSNGRGVSLGASAGWPPMINDGEMEWMTRGIGTGSQGEHGPRQTAGRVALGALTERTRR